MALNASVHLFQAELGQPRNRAAASHSPAGTPYAPTDAAPMLNTWSASPKETSTATSGARPCAAAPCPGALLAGGWQLNTVFSAYTGLPFSAYADATSLNAPQNAQIADQLVSVRILQQVDGRPCGVQPKMLFHDRGKAPVTVALRLVHEIMGTNKG